jgi:hypothetical protein
MLPPVRRAYEVLKGLAKLRGIVIEGIRHIFEVEKLTAEQGSWIKFQPQACASSSLSSPPLLSVCVEAIRRMGSDDWAEPWPRHASLPQYCATDKVPIPSHRLDPDPGCCRESVCVCVCQAMQGLKKV